MFHVERFKISTILKVVFVVFFLMMIPVSCVAPRATVQIADYTLLRGGKEILGKKEGLVAFVFENNQRKIPFVQFIANKYSLGKYYEVEYWVTIEGTKFKVYLYENAEIEKYFDTSAFTISNVEPDSAIVGSKANFLALSMVSESNEDCLAHGSLYQNIAIEYLLNLKREYNNS